MTDRPDPGTNMTPAPDLPRDGGDRSSADERSTLADRGTGETAGYTGGKAAGVGGAAGARQLQADDAGPDAEPDANAAQGDT